MQNKFEKKISSIIFKHYSNFDLFIQDNKGFVPDSKMLTSNFKGIEIFVKELISFEEGFFSSDKSNSSSPSTPDNVLKKNKAMIAELKQRLKLLDDNIKKELRQSKEYVNEGKHDLSMKCLERKKLFEASKEKLTIQTNNLITITEKIEEAINQKRIFEQTKESANKLKEVIQQIDVKKSEDINRRPLPGENSKRSDLNNDRRPLNDDNPHEINENGVNDDNKKDMKVKEFLRKNRYFLDSITSLIRMFYWVNLSFRSIILILDFVITDKTEKDNAIKGIQKRVKEAWGFDILLGLNVGGKVVGSLISYYIFACIDLKDETLSYDERKKFEHIIFQTIFCLDFYFNFLKDTGPLEKGIKDFKFPREIVMEKMKELKGMKSFEEFDKLIVFLINNGGVAFDLSKHSIKYCLGGWKTMDNCKKKDCYIDVLQYIYDYYDDLDLDERKRGFYYNAHTVDNYFSGSKKFGNGKRAKVDKNEKEDEERDIKLKKISDDEKDVIAKKIKFIKSSFQFADGNTARKFIYEIFSILEFSAEDYTIVGDGGKQKIWPDEFEKEDFENDVYIKCQKLTKDGNDYFELGNMKFLIIRLEKILKLLSQII